MSVTARRGSPPLVFLDTNVIFSGLYSPDGPPGAILRSMIEGKIVAVVSRQVLDELVRTLKRKLPHSLPLLREFLLNSPLRVIRDPDFEDITAWIDLVMEGDASILLAAISAEPDFFVTGDSHFLDNQQLRKKSDLTICSPAELLSNLEQ